MKINDILIGWYHENKRDLPWRKTKDPYRIWLSEIILQQTRVDQGMDYYLRFVRRYPDIRSLAKASEQEILKMWQGLGYYSRARNMLATARKIQSESGGKFPADYDAIIKHKGIGPYTASAIASIAFNEPYPVMDGNVKRVISRLFGVKAPVNSSKGIRQINDILVGLIDRNNPGDFNQAMMEFGALNCKPSNPLCDTCPLSNECQANISGWVDKLPVLERKSEQKKRTFNYLVLISTDEDDPVLCIRKRTGDDIWKNMYDFPFMEDKDLKVDLSQAKLLKTTSVYKHQLTHQLIFAKFFIYSIPSPQPSLGQAAPRHPDVGQDHPTPGIKIIPLYQLDQYPFPRLIDKFMQGELIPEIKKIEV